MSARQETASTVLSRPPRNVRPRRRRLRWSTAGVSRRVIIIVGAVLMASPLLWLLGSSFLPTEKIFGHGVLPDLSAFTVDNYVDGWTALDLPFWRYLLNSAVIVALSIVGNVFSCSLAAYAFARMRFRGRPVLFTLMLLTIMLPVHVTIIPQYVLFSKLGLINTIVPLVLPKFLAVDAFFIFLMIQFIRSIPRELDEAAQIDGAGHLRIFTQIIFPLLRPAIGTTIIFTFIWTWNDFFAQLIYLTKPDSYTVPLALRAFIDSDTASNYGQSFAMSIVSLLPIFLIFLFGQRSLINGISTTGGK